MNDKFDELAKGMAQSVTRRGALKKFCVGLTGVLLASLGLPNTSQAGKRCLSAAECPSGQYCDFSGRCKGVANFGNCDHCNDTTNYGCSFFNPDYATCVAYCNNRCNPAC